MKQYMDKSLSKRVASCILVTLMFCLLFFSFWNGSDRQFQLDSENLVVGAMYFGRNENERSVFSLVSAQIKGDNDSTVHIYDYYVSNDASVTPLCWEYKSQIGLQGMIFASVSKALSFLSLKTCVYLFRFLCALAMVCVALLIIILLFYKYNVEFAGIFCVTFAFSPWIRNFAPNLYWVSFTWFLPMLLGLWMSCDYRRRNRWWMYSLIFISIFIKCACGYEYISTIMMGLIIFPLVDMITATPEKRKELIFIIVKMGLAALLAFVTALCVHAVMRSRGSLICGLQTIWKEDVLRRTLGGQVENFDAAYSESLTASIMDTIQIYLHFPTELIHGVESKWFGLLQVISLTIFLVRGIRRRQYRWELVFLILSFVSSVSWFALGKSHSYAHTHMNYVLWYFGYIQACIYSITIVLSDLIKAVCAEE